MSKSKSLREILGAERYEQMKVERVQRMVANRSTFLDIIRRLNPRKVTLDEYKRLTDYHHPLASNERIYVLTHGLRNGKMWFTALGQYDDLPCRVHVRVSNIIEVTVDFEELSSIGYDISPAEACQLFAGQLVNFHDNHKVKFLF